MRCLLPALSLLAVACDRPDPCALVAEAGEPSLQIGIGDPDRFPGPAVAGAEIVPSFGAQGGQHLWLSVRTAAFWPGTPRGLGTDADVPTFRAALFDAAGAERTAQGWGWGAMDGDELDAALALGELFLPEPALDAEGVPVALEPVRLVVTGEDVCGTVAIGEVSFSIVW